MSQRYLKKVSERVAPPGLEMRLLRWMPKAMLAGTLVPIMLALGARAWSRADDSVAVAKQVLSVDIFAFALFVTSWTAILTVTIGAVVVFIMKGPAYEADPYPIPHNQRNRL